MTGDDAGSGFVDFPNDEDRGGYDPIVVDTSGGCRAFLRVIRRTPCAAGWIHWRIDYRTQLIACRAPDESSLDTDPDRLYLYGPSHVGMCVS